MKLSQDDLKTPDQVWQAGKQSYEWASHRWKLLTALVVLVFLAGVGYNYSHQRSIRIESEAQFYLGQIKTFYEQAQLTKEPAEEVKDPKADPKKAATNKAEEAKKAEAKKVEAAESLKKMDEAMVALETKYPKSKAAALALFYKGHRAYTDYKLDEALTYFSQLSDKLKGELGSMAWLPAAEISESLKKYDDALKFYEKMIQSKVKTLKSEGLLGKGRVLRLQNKTKEALSIYTEFLKDFPEHEDAKLVRGLQSELEGKI